jgi:hypothetical protein
MCGAPVTCAMWPRPFSYVLYDFFESSKSNTHLKLAKQNKHMADFDFYHARFWGIVTPCLHVSSYCLEKTPIKIVLTHIRKLRLRSYWHTQLWNKLVQSTLVCILQFGLLHIHFYLFILRHLNTLLQLHRLRTIVNDRLRRKWNVTNMEWHYIY